MFTWRDNNNEKFLLLFCLWVCVCWGIYVEKFYDVSNENLAHSSTEWAHTDAHIYTCFYMYLYRWVCLRFWCEQNIHEQIYVHVCVFIITNTILSIKINSTKGNRADASAFFLHSVHSSDNPGENIGSTELNEETHTISVELHTHMYCRDVV